MNANSTVKLLKMARNCLKWKCFDQMLYLYLKVIKFTNEGEGNT